MSEATDPDVVVLNEPRTIRERCHLILTHASAGNSSLFVVNRDRLSAVVDEVVSECRANYPAGDIPVHGRFRHYDMDNIDRIGQLKSQLSKDPLERSVALVDLVMVSVLLDAGSGPDWKVLETATNRTYNRSEGLAVAVLQYFVSGGFSSRPDAPLQVDAKRLQALTANDMKDMFQITSANPLVGTEGRLLLLRNLGVRVAEDLLHFSGIGGDLAARPGNLARFLFKQAKDKSLPARDVLVALLESLGPIWPGRIKLGSTALGDVWRHPNAGGAGRTAGLVPFHKLSQWLSYSLFEPLAEAGLTITDPDVLTGLPEYRNGGLFLDLGLLAPRDEAAFTQAWNVDDPFVVEWRALTVALLDEVAQEVRKKLGKTAAQLPLASILQGGTWSAGRRIAKNYRPGGGPPLKINSDGTVF